VRTWIGRWHRRTWLRGAAILVLLCLGLAGPSRVTATDAVKAAEFTAKDLTGATISLSKLLEEGPVLLDFFTTCCQPCQRALPGLDRLDRAYRGRGFRVVAVSQDDPKTAQKVKPFVQSKGFEMIVIADPKKEIGNVYHVRQIPTAFLIGRDGSIVHFAQGYVPGDDVKWEEMVQGLLGPGSGTEDGQHSDGAGKQ
jgi:peroxiredoxin